MSKLCTQGWSEAPEDRVQSEEGPPHNGLPGHRRQETATGAEESIYIPPQNRGHLHCRRKARVVPRGLRRPTPSHHGDLLQEAEAA